MIVSRYKIEYFTQMRKKFLKMLLAVVGLSLNSYIFADTWTDPEVAAKEDPLFDVQGEYGIAEKGQAWAVQVIAMGDGKLDAYALEGGFPGLGFEKGKKRIHLTGELKDGIATLSSQDKITEAVIKGRSLALKMKGEEVGSLSRVERKSATLGAKAQEGAIILFDGTDADAWEKGEVVDGLLRNNDIKTKRKFGSYTLHLEFRTPYKPKARGQGRGNSGVYHQHRYETQVLDSFGLEGKNNEAGGIYQIAAPKLNMCFPPLTWQTYDVDFTTAEFNDAGKLTKPASMSVRLNGVEVHKDQELPKTTGGAGLKLAPEPGPIYIQGHGNPVFYRNIWIVEK